MRTAAEIRKAFLDFFQGKEHLLVPSSSLIPAGDPTLLLTSAGMVQFKPYFTGEMTPPQPRLTSVQKCFRVSDVDSVGDTIHLTFFEMLGNFSIGDYFKKEAIAWGWEFVTQQMGLKPEQLWATVFRDDDEAYALWQKTGIPAERIRRFDEKDNFWGPAGDEGPCGPCSEIHYDFGGKCRLGKSDAECGPNCECGRFLELWNLVFMQFYQDKQGKRAPLPRPNIDTGMGLERAALILQGKASIYETDLFMPIIERVCKLANRQYGQDAETDKAIRVVAEHARSAAFLIADGVVPDNKGRGYVLRRLIRRAIRFGRQVGLVYRERGFLVPVTEVVIGQMGSVYPELASGREFILRVLQLEEEQFGEVYERGLEILRSVFNLAGVRSGKEIVWKPEGDEGRLWPNFEDSVNAGIRTLKSVPTLPQDLWEIILNEENHMFEEPIMLPSDIVLQPGSHSFLKSQLGYVYRPIQDWRASAPKLAALVTPRMLEALKKALREAEKRAIAVSGEVAFLLYDTYGFPVELTAEIAREQHMDVDMEGFQREMEAQRQRARAASGFGTGLDAVRVYQELGVAGTRFLGYETTSAPSVVVALLVNGISADRADEGQQVEVVLRETPFYAEGGGQAGDTGFIEAPGWYVQVEDTQSPIAGLIVHKGRVVRGTAQLGEMVTATVDRERRMDCARNHTATHLLHAALRQVLGTHVRQQGSMVAPDRLRFDFTHVSQLSPEELQQVEALVNDRIRANVPVHKRETTYRQAVAEGALAFFGERYGDRVRVVEVPEGHQHEQSVRPEPVEGRADAHGSTSSPRTDTPKPFSFEVCGGTHVDATGDIGYCHVLGESSVGAGLRRIEAVTGRAAETLVRDQEARLGSLVQLLESTPQDMETRVKALLLEVASLRRQLDAHERESIRQKAQGMVSGQARIEEVSGIRYVSEVTEASSPEALRMLGDFLRDRIKTGVVILGAVVNDRPTLLVMVTSDLVARGLHAGNIVKEAAKVMGGGGGGRPEMAQAGGRQADKLEEALRTAVAMVAQRVNKTSSEH